MYAVSEAFAEAVRRDHVAVVRVVTMLNGVETGELTVIDGGVTIDARREGPLRSISLTVSDDAAAWDALTTPGAEIKAWRGIALPTGDELVPLGVFVIDGKVVQRNTDGQIVVSGADRAMRISRARWTDPYTVASGTGIGAAIAAVLTDRWPQVTIGFTTTGISTAAQVVFTDGEASDPWKDARSLASDHGYDLYFDGDGVARMRTVPDPASSPVDATYVEGDDGLVLEKSRAVTPLTYNGVRVTGEGTNIDEPVQAYAWDEDPYSPSYIGGPMGMVPTFYSSPLLTTVEMCEAAAATRLSKLKGRAQEMSFTVVVNPAHDAYDVIETTDLDGVTSRYMLDSLTVPLLASQPMPATTRETRIP